MCSQSITPLDAADGSSVWARYARLRRADLWTFKGFPPGWGSCPEHSVGHRSALSGSSLTDQEARPSSALPRMPFGILGSHRALGQVRVREFW